MKTKRKTNGAKPNRPRRFAEARGYTALRKWLRQTERKCIREGVMAVVTDAGKAVVRLHAPLKKRLTKSQERYRRFLDADSGLRFGEWLKRDRMLNAGAQPPRK